MKAIVHVIILSIFTAGSLQLLLPTRFVIFAAIVALLGIGLWREQSRSQALGLVLIFSAVIAGIGAVAFFAYPSLDPSLIERVFRIVLLLPLAVAAGAAVLQGVTWTAFANAFLFWATVFAGLALIESFRGTGFFARPLLEVISQTTYRSVLAAEHPLVLATLLLAAVPIACRVRTRGLAVALVTLLAFGILTTQSSGPLGVLLAFVVSKSVASLVPQWSRAFSTIFGVFALALVAWLVLPGLASSATGAFVSSADSDEASIQYRFELYSTMWHSLSVHPWGWGFEGLPPGALLVRSSFGNLDLSRTVDSEAVLAAFDWGILGVGAFAVILALPLFRRLRNHANAEMLLVVTTAGLFLALHSWVGLGTLWAILVGSTIADFRRQAEAEKHWALTAQASSG